MFVTLSYQSHNTSPFSLSHSQSLSRYLFKTYPYSYSIYALFEYLLPLRDLLTLVIPCSPTNLSIYLDIDCAVLHRLRLHSNQTSFFYVAELEKNKCRWLYETPCSSSRCKKGVSICHTVVSASIYRNFAITAIDLFRDHFSVLSHDCVFENVQKTNICFSLRMDVSEIIRLTHFAYFPYPETDIIMYQKDE